MPAPQTWAGHSARNGALFFPADAASDAFALAAVGLAAVVGHRRPVWHRFRGGGGVAVNLPILVGEVRKVMARQGAPVQDPGTW
jgi:glycerol-3-phosphate acyltransferase PlsY